MKSNPYQFMWNMFWYIEFSFHPRNSKSFKLFQQKYHVLIIIPNRIPGFNDLLVSNKHVIIPIVKFVFWWQITIFFNNYHVSKHIYGNFIPRSWTWSCFNFHNWQTYNESWQFLVAMFWWCSSPCFIRF